MGTIQPRLTKQDYRENSGIYLNPRDPGYTRENEKRATETPCEHDYRITDSCPLCDLVEDRLEDATEAQRSAYWLIVAYEASHRIPKGSKVDRRTANALARRSLVTVHTNPARGPRAWTAVPSGATRYTDEYTHVDVDLA